MTTTKLSEYRAWLETALNASADQCREYARAGQESPPESMSAPYEVLSEAWDAFCIIIELDGRYKNAKIKEFAINNHDLDRDNAYHLYVSQMQDRCKQKDAVKTLEQVTAKLRATYSD
jgi:hypothetical protein